VKILKTPTTAAGDEVRRERYEFDVFRLDCRTRELWRDSELVPLAPKAFDLLCALLGAEGAVVEKNELIKQVWPTALSLTTA